MPKVMLSKNDLVEALYDELVHQAGASIPFGVRNFPPDDKIEIQAQVADEPYGPLEGLEVSWEWGGEE